LVYFFNEMIVNLYFYEFKKNKLILLLIIKLIF
jgi:hypothetical protein